MLMSESGVPESVVVTEPQKPGTAAGDNLNDMKWVVAPEESSSGGADTTENQSSQPTTDTQAVTGDTGISPIDKTAGTEWRVATTQESGARLQSMDVTNLSGRQLIEAITTVSQNPSMYDRATLDGLVNHSQMTEALRALDDPRETSQQLSQISAETTRRVAESIQRVADESFNPQTTTPENVLDHLRKVAAKPGVMTGEELVKLHTYLNNNPDSTSLTNQLVELDPKVYEHIQTLSQELERRGIRSQELVRAAATLLNPEQAEAIATANTVDAEAAELDIEQVVAGQAAKLTTPDGKQYSIQDIGILMAWMISDCIGLGNGESFDMFANWMGERFLLRIGIDQELVTRISKESNMSLRALDVLTDDQINNWFGKQLKGREIYNILKLFKNTERTRLMNSEKFIPHQVQKSAIKAETLIKMWQELKRDGVSAEELAKLGLTYPSSTS